MQILTDSSDAAQLTAIRANLCEFFRHLGRSWPEGHLEQGKFDRWQTPVPHPWFNGVLASAPPEAADERFIENSLDFFREKSVSAVTWWLDSALPVDDWKPLMSRHGFRFSDDTPGLALALDKLIEPFNKPAGVEIRPVDDEAALHTWAEVFTRGYDLPSAWEPLIFEQGLRLGLDRPVKNYIGYWQGKAVATSVLFEGAGVAGIYSVATLHEARGRGIGAAVTLEPLREARQLGYQTAVLQSSEMGFSVYQRLGFRHLGPVENFYRSLR